MGKIFVSYRREDSIETAGRIYDWLDSRLTPHSIFMDVESIPVGADFRDAIRNTIKSSDMVLVIIGPKWLTAADMSGNRRIDNASDFVRSEIESAIEHGIPVIPVLVQGSKMPAAGDVPSSLAPLVYRNAVNIRPNPDFGSDMTRLVKGIEAIAPDLTFTSPSSQETGGSETKAAPPTIDETKPAIPEGATTDEYGFYYTKVITRRIAGDNSTLQFLLVKTFAFEDSPKSQHTLRIELKKSYSWVLGGNPIYAMSASIDGNNIAFKSEEFNIKKAFNEHDWYLSGGEYERSIILNGRKYATHYQFKIEPNRSDSNKWSWTLYTLEVRADGNMLFDIDRY